MTQPFASLDEALEWLDDHIDYERVAPTRRLLPSLAGVDAALALLGHPEDSYRIIHITGTNGKGSTTAMATALLSEAGLRVGTYTSPNLHRVNERIAVAEQAIADEAFAELLDRIRLVEDRLDERLTRFELLTIAALEHFSDEAVDVAVIEVGLGGTWDSTNVVDADVCVITNVSLDHVAVLGSTPEEIAADKAGIITAGSTVIVGDVSDGIAQIIGARADESGALGLWRLGSEFTVSSNRLAFGGRVVDFTVPGEAYRDIHVPLHGSHQGANAATALAAVTALLGRAPSAEIVEAGFGRVEVWGRLEVLGHQPLLMVDGAHNAAGAAALSNALQEGFDVAGLQVAVLGMLEGRDPLDLLGPLRDGGISTVVCVAPVTPRAKPVDEIAQAAQELGLVTEVAASIPEGVDRAIALAGENGMVLATGSLYVVGPARQRLLERLVTRS